MTTMRTIKILLLLVLTTSQSALAYNLKIDTVVVTNDSCRTLQLIATIDNTDNEALWIWLDNNDYGRDHRKAIRRYLMKRRGDFSIFDIGADPNMIGDWWHPSAPKYCFVKYLEPGKTFTIIWRTRQTLWRAVQMLTQKLCCQTIHDCPKVVPLHYESE